MVAEDYNDDVRGTTIHQFFRNLIMDKMIHRQHGRTAPNTYINGSVPID
jgi:hypothetical protein